MTDYQNSISPWYGLHQDNKHMKNKISVLERQVKLLEECKQVFEASHNSHVSEGDRK